MAARRATPVDYDAWHDRQTGGAESGLGTLFMHGKRRGEHAGMGVGNLQDLQKPLHTAIFAPTSVKRVEGGVGLDLAQTLGKIVAGIDLRDVEALLAQRIGASPSRDEAHLALRRTPTQHDSHPLERRHDVPSLL